MAKKDVDGWGTPATALAACTVIGTGIGMLYGATSTYAVIGAGVGLLVMAVLKSTGSSK